MKYNWVIDKDNWTEISCAQLIPSLYFYKIVLLYRQLLSGQREIILQ